MDGSICPTKEMCEGPLTFVDEVHARWKPLSPWVHVVDLYGEHEACAEATPELIEHISWESRFISRQIFVQ